MAVQNFRPGLTWSFFKSMDTNGDNRISYSEFNDFLEQSGHKWILNDPNFFQKLDRNRDGGLDFEEELTFYYIIKTRCVMCRGCTVYLCGLYFTCVACFDGADHNTYDLCAVCYRNWNYNHYHSYFLDNRPYIATSQKMLKSSGNGSTTTEFYTVVYNSYYVQPTPPPRTKWYQAYRLLEAGLAIANLVTNCAIM